MILDITTLITNKLTALGIELFQVILFFIILILLILDIRRESSTELKYLFVAFSLLFLIKIYTAQFYVDKILDGDIIEDLHFQTPIIVYFIETIAVLLLAKSFIHPIEKEEINAKNVLNLKTLVPWITLSFIVFQVLQILENQNKSYFFAIFLSSLFFIIWQVIIIAKSIFTLVESRFKYKKITLIAFIFFGLSKLFSLAHAALPSPEIDVMHYIDLALGALSLPIFGFVIYLGLESKLLLNRQILESVNRELRQINLNKEIVAEKLLEEKKKIEAIIDSMAEGVIVVNIQENLLLLNSSAKEMFGTFDNIHEKDITNFIKKTKLKPVFENLETITKPTVREVHYQEMGKILKANISPLLNKQQKIMGFVTVLEDITKLKQLDEMKSEFVSIVSHELRTPLTSIKGYSSLLLHEKLGKLSDKQKQCLNVIDSEANRLTNLINDVLDISKMEAGKLELKATLIDLRIVLKECATVSLAKRKKIRIIKKIPNNIKKVYADKDKIQQVVTNLLSNAIKFTPEKGTITIEMKNKGNWVTVAIKDTGIGIPKKLIPKIFDKFVQVEHHMTRKQGGTGLGLAIVKEIINLHNGMIECRSALNKGTVFKFCLPTYHPKKIELVKCYEKRGCKYSDCSLYGQHATKCWLTFGTKEGKTATIDQKIETCRDCGVFTRNIEGYTNVTFGPMRPKDKAQ